MRIGINVPNETLERFKPLKNIYNLSEICRDAIKSRIESYEKALDQAKNDDVYAVADRLSSEYVKKTILDWEAIGRNDAKVWVQLATLKDFEDLFHNIEIHKKKGRKPGQFLGRIIPGTKWYEDHYAEYDYWFKRQYEIDGIDIRTQAETEYIRGWLSHITAVWQMVKERIAADVAARRKAKEESKEKPVIPDNLRESLR